MGADGAILASVVIPTYQRAEKLRRCVERLGRQAGLEGGSFEVLVGLDGPDEASARAAREGWSAGGGAEGGLVVVECARAGYNATRNAVLSRARGRLLVSLNDDVLPEPGLIASHVWAHDEARGRLGHGRSIVVGWSPFVEVEGASVLDELCAHSSMLFFYDRMIGPTAVEGADDPWRDWGFRHCYGLNFSADLAAVREAGGFVALPMAYGYDDIEMAHRLGWRSMGSGGAPVLFRPGARADHDHRYGAAEVLEREVRLGRSAWHFAAERPEFARAVFGREVRSVEEVSYSRAFVRREEGAARRLEESFLGLERLEARALGSGAERLAMLRLVYEQHLLLKRWHWRRGLLMAAESSAG